MNPEYSEYFARFYAPILFFFGVLTVVLSAMQVVLQAQGDKIDAGAAKGEYRWIALRSSSLWFSVATLLCICGIGLVISLLFLFMLLRELAFAVKNLMRRRRKVGMDSKRLEGS